MLSLSDYTPPTVLTPQVPLCICEHFLLILQAPFSIHQQEICITLLFTLKRFRVLLLHYKRTQLFISWHDANTFSENWPLSRLSFYLLGERWMASTSSLAPHCGCCIEVRRYQISRPPLSIMMTSWHVNFSHITVPHKGTAILSLDVIFDVEMYTLFNKQSSGRWFEMPWRPCDVTVAARRIIKEFKIFNSNLK